MMQLPMVLPERSIGRELAEEGMKRTLEAEREAWIDGVLVAMRKFAALPEWREFKVEDFRAWYLAEGYPEPHDHHCWGAITNRASNAKVIRFTGRYATSVSPKTRGHYVRIWTAA